jgi:hypothetical protein
MRVGRDRGRSAATAGRGMETLGILVLMILAYGIGVAVSSGLALIGGVRLAASGAGAAALVLGLPLAATLLAEAVTGQWQDTPGAVGTGPLVVAGPMAVSGLGAMAVLLAVRLGLPPLRLGGEAPAGNLSAWLGVALGVATAAVALWHFWPAPRARLF